MFDENIAINRGERERAQFPWRRNKLAPRATPRFLPSFLPSRPSITTLDRVEVFAFFFSFSLLFCADCGSNLSVPGAASGVFTSPKWPDKYDRSSGLLSCSWQVQSARDHRILLHFESFSIEGEQESEFSFFFFFFGLVLLHLFDIDSSWMRRGRRAGLEETGRTARGNLRRKAQRRTRNFHVGRQRDESDVSRLSKYILSLLCVKRCVLLHRFILADKVAGGRGFRAVWTEVKSGYDCDEASHFRCANNSFCIAKQLECDGNLNCGVHDDSDEAHCNYGRLFLSFTKKKKKKKLFLLPLTRSQIIFLKQKPKGRMDNWLAPSSSSSCLSLIDPFLSFYFSSSLRRESQVEPSGISPSYPWS